MNKVFTNKGVALLMVLWVLMLLTVIVSEFCYSMRTRVNITRNFKESTQAYYIAVAGFNHAVVEIIKQVNTPRKIASVDYDTNEDEEKIDWRVNTDIAATVFGNGEYTVRIDNDSGKININQADKGLLHLMLNGFELDEREKDVIVDSILDWKDADSNHRINGAEDQYYQSLPDPYKCRNADFDSIEELLLVKGVTPDIYYGGLDRMTTVISAIKDAKIKKRSRKKRSRKKGTDYNKVNINAISPQLWRAFPGMTDDLVTQIVEYRKTKDFQSINELKQIVGPDVYAGIYRYLTLHQSSYYTIRSTGTITGSRIFEGVEGIIRLDNRIKKKYQVVQWKDGISDHEYFNSSLPSTL
ncbi:MAG: general secretion pathway protein GspK [Dissulfuribacterales bacterium]